MEAYMQRSIEIITTHGTLRTPFFMPIATKGSVKGLTTGDIERLDAPILLSNTYHLYLRPGLDVLYRSGGLHSFMRWEKPILTDSGGYQAFSLGRKHNSLLVSSSKKKQGYPILNGDGGGGGDGLVRITDNGVEFKDHISGAKHLFTPEKALDIQAVIGSDIRMVLDVCSPYPSTYKQAKKDVERTLQWAERSLEYKHKQPEDYLLFCIVQGSCFEDLRIDCAKKLVALGFDGYAIGGVSVGESWDDAQRVMDLVLPILPPDKPRYMMGVGKPEQILCSLENGVDMFDCVIPTREARHGRLYINTPPGLGSYQTLSITNEQYKIDFSPISQHSKLTELRQYSKAYLRHLFMCDDPLALRLATLNNLEFYLRLMTL